MINVPTMEGMAIVISENGAYSRQLLVFVFYQRSSRGREMYGSSQISDKSICRQILWFI